MRELHERLAALGLERTQGGGGEYDTETVALVEAFQRSRGLPLSGVVDATTWERLDEARWQLGHRLLYLTRPNLRGDDVAELQVLLAQLGFDPGRIDGIFGPLLETALGEFQRNRALEATGVLTKATLQELGRVRATNAARSLVNDARDLAGLHRPRSDTLLVCGEGALAAALAHAWGDAPGVHVLLDTPHDRCADYANAHDLALVLSCQDVGGVDGVRLHYWASYRSHSRRGELVASDLAAALAQVVAAPRVEVTGMALPILRETVMTTVHVEHGRLSDEDVHRVVTAWGVVLDVVFHK